MKPYFHIFLCLILSACNSSLTPEQDYVKRLKTVLGIQYTNTEHQENLQYISFPAFPQANQLKLNTQTGQLTIREFLSLRECQLHTTIAHRNSSIGKVSSPSQQLFSDIMILQQGPDCLSLIKNNELANKVKQFLALKNSQLNETLWFAILAQDEHRQFWRARDYQEDYPDNENQEVINTIKSLTRFTNKIIKKDFSFTKKEFSMVEEQLSALRFGDGGQLINTYLQQINTLNRANKLIQTRLNKPLCLHSTPTPKARYFDNVIRTFFIDKVQRKAVKLNQRADALLQVHRQLELPLISSANNSYRKWAKKRDSILLQGRSITTKHVELIQALFKQCGLSPQTNNN